MVIIEWVLYTIVFTLLTIVNKELKEYYLEQTVIIKAIGITTSNIITKVYGFLGIFALYTTALNFTNKHVLSEKNIGTYCFEVYLFQ